MKNASVKFVEEYELAISYKGERTGLRRDGFWIENSISLEIKARSELDNTHLAQAINYVEAFGVPAGLLINFGASSLQFRSIHNKTLLK